MSDPRPPAEPRYEVIADQLRGFLATTNHGPACPCRDCRLTRPPAAESGTPAPGEVGLPSWVREWLATHTDRDNYTLSEAHDALDDAWQALASLLSASPASETPDRAALGRDIAEALRPMTVAAARETPGPGEGDMRGEVECGACQGDETADLRCPKSRRTCGHHCNHVMTHDACDWCGTTWGENGEQSDVPQVEAIAARVHEAWMETKRAQGITSRPSEWGEEQMVPYADLTERAKDLDRGSVRAVLDAIDAAGLVLTSRTASGTTEAGRCRYWPGCQHLSPHDCLGGADPEADRGGTT